MSDYVYVIEKNIEIPKIVRRCKYPFREMEIGDSIFFPGRTVSGVLGASQYSTPTYKFTTRTVIKNGVKGVRIWRVL